MRISTHPAAVCFYLVFGLVLFFWIFPYSIEPSFSRTAVTVNWNFSDVSEVEYTSLRNDREAAMFADESFKHDNYEFASLMPGEQITIACSTSGFGYAQKIEDKYVVFDVRFDDDTTTRIIVSISDEVLNAEAILLDNYWTKED